MVFFLVPYGLYSQTTPQQKIESQLSDIKRGTETDIETQMNLMKGDEKRLREQMEKDKGVVVVKLTKKELERIREIRKVDPADLEKNKDFLKNDKTGIFRLFPNFFCRSTNVVKIDGDCTNFVPESSYFSFRTKQYADPMNQDLGLVYDELISGGFFSQGVFVSLGNVPLEDVTLDNADLKYLTDLPTLTEFSAARDRAAQLRAGIKSGQFTYASHAKAVENNTYAFRLTAYKFGNSLTPASPKSSPTELLFLSLAFDKRVDSIITFRIVRKGPDGNITILWKELSRKDAPKLRFAKGEALADFKTLK